MPFKHSRAEKSIRPLSISWFVIFNWRESTYPLDTLIFQELFTTVKKNSRNRKALISGIRKNTKLRMGV